MLEDAGTEVVSAYDGREAVNIYDESLEGAFDAVLIGHNDAKHGRICGDTRHTPLRKKRRRHASDHSRNGPRF